MLPLLITKKTYAMALPEPESFDLARRRRAHPRVRAALRFPRISCSYGFLKRDNDSEGGTAGRGARHLPRGGHGGRLGVAVVRVA